ncbi:hypothetical protein J25TS5_39540 [Paenibacillus faecis]|nr:hypothetical protein J25TS5_39540 [Paenibacillus faecis]
MGMEKPPDDLEADSAAAGSVWTGLADPEDKGTSAEDSALTGGSASS